uniref:Uncharacterized protein n=1 Tax=Ditylenchus dipsaci TaxID=166011 RepID=A0A915EB55_9BILA
MTSQIYFFDLLLLSIIFNLLRISLALPSKSRHSTDDIFQNLSVNNSSEGSVQKLAQENNSSSADVLSKLLLNKKTRKSDSEAIDIRKAQTSAENYTISTAEIDDDLSAEENLMVRRSANPTTKDYLNRTSQLLCQFFVFGILFGVGCSISTCTCFYRSRPSTTTYQSSFTCDAPASMATCISNGIPEPFDYSKPCCLKVDEQGLCYASPLPTGEIPALPSYEQALSMASGADALVLLRV